MTNYHIKTVNGIFKYPVAIGIIPHNPVALIKFKHAERQNRECLSEDEIKTFLERIKEIKYNDVRQFAYTLYFFGLRPYEIDEETHREGDFLIARNRKRKNGKIEYKKIPIPTQAQGLIDWNKPLTADLHRLKINDIMKELLEGKTAYSLRHTFATVCQLYVRPDIPNRRFAFSANTARFSSSVINGSNNTLPTNIAGLQVGKSDPYRILCAPTSSIARLNVP